MRLIPKNTKVKMQFYKSITFVDVVLALFVMLVIALVVSGNLPHRFIIAMGILCVCLPMFLSIGDERLYMSAFYLLRHLFNKNAFKGAEVDGLIPFEGIEQDCIKNKDGSYVGIIEIKPTEFRLFSQDKQDYLIDAVFATALESVGERQMSLIKLQKPLRLERHIQGELDRLSALIANKENEILSQKEYESRVDILQDRITLLDELNSSDSLNYSACYIAVFDKNARNLAGSLQYIKQLFNTAKIGAEILMGDELEEFVLLNTPKPETIEFRAMNTKVDDKTLSHFVVCDYPLRVGNAWGAELFDIPDTKVVMSLKAVEKSKAIRRIDSAIMELSAQNRGKASKVIDKSTHVETLSSLLVRLQNDNETMFDVTLMITAFDQNGSNSVKKSVRRKLRELGLSFNEMFGRQQDVYLSSGLSEYDKLNISRGMQSTAVAACFPFVSGARIDESGIILGENTLPVAIDFFKRDSDHINSNMVIIGKSGSGKSYAVKTLLANLSADDVKIFVLDVDGEYKLLAENLGGRVLDTASAKHGRLNPFQIIASLDDENEDGSRNSFFAHLQFLEEFFRVILQGINADCLELINRLILEVYSNKGITPQSNLDDFTPKDYPIMDDLAQLIEQKLENETDKNSQSCLKTLANYMAKFKSGGRNSAIWNGYSSLNASENFVCFDFQRLLANKNNVIANGQMLLILKWIENEVAKNRDYNQKNGTDRKIVVLTEEAHVLIDEKYPIALDFLYQLGKRIRKYNGMQIVVTQNLKDFLGTPQIARKSTAIINVSQYSLIFSLSPNDMSDLIALYEKAGQINDSESASIIYNPCGHAFLISSPTSRTNLKITATPFVEGLFK